MVEPPGDFRGTGIFEINDGVFVTIEILLVKQRAGAMQQTGENELDVATNPLAIKTGKERGRRGPVKTFVVIEHPNSQTYLPPWPDQTDYPKPGPNQKQIEGGFWSVRRNGPLPATSGALAQQDLTRFSQEKRKRYGQEECFAGTRGLNPASLLILVGTTQVVPFLQII